MTQPIIRFQAVSKSFGAQTVLRDFSLDVEPGAFVTVIGRSGCGKTTVLKLVNGLLAPDTGRVLVQGQDVARADPVALRRHIGYAIQSHPERGPVSPHDRGEEHCLCARHLRPGGMEGEAARRKGRRPAEAGGAGPGAGGAVSPRPLRRAAPAGGHCPGSGRRPGASADGRALRRGGRDFCASTGRAASPSCL